MPKDVAYQTAIQHAVVSLRSVDLETRCRDLALPEIVGGELTTRMFGTDVVLNTTTFDVCRLTDGQPVKVADRILLLHYLLCPYPIAATGELISFREFPGGQFYLPSFAARTTEPLVGRFGNDVAALRQNLDRFDWWPVAKASLGARVHAYGELYVTLLYQTGDDEFPAEATVLFDSACKRALDAEDAAVMASRICIGLL